MFRTILRGALYTAYLLTVVSAVFYFGFWRSYRSSLLQRDAIHADMRLEPARHVDAATMRLLGSVHQEKASSFVNFEQTKASGVVRVCALGDSNTEGAELGGDSDYPSYLQRMFRNHGYGHVEVLNFGNGWYGFSQTYVMWKYVARKFSCDFVLLLPVHHWSSRDVTFNHSDGLYPGYLHARLVLEDGRLRLIAPLGASADQRTRAYYRPIPRWQYLRYDRHPPNIFDAPFQGRRRLPNPFYYDRRSETDEVRDIYAEIVRSIVEDGTGVAILFKGENQAFYPYLLSDLQDNVGAALVDETRPGFPYTAPAGHPSSWGQELTAMAYFELLTNGTRFELPTITAADVLSDLGQQNEPVPLHAFSESWFEYRGRRSAYFVPENTQALADHDIHAGLLSRDRISAILSLTRPGGSIAHSCLLPLADLPTADAELVYKPDDGGQQQSLGRVEQLQPDLAIFRVLLPQSFVVSCSAEPEDLRTRDGTLILNDRAVGRLRANELESVHGTVIVVRDSGEHRGSVESLTTPENLEFVLRQGDETELRRPLIQIRRSPSGVRLHIKHRPTRTIESAVNP